MRKNWHRHFGGYGICIDKDSNEMMVIKKVRGPYSGRYDLPGGGVKMDESIKEAIIREFLEETGYEIDTIVNKGTYDFLVAFDYNGTTHTHHVANFFEVKDQLKKKRAKEVDVDLVDEKNDSAGVEWIKLSDLNEENSSPLVIKALNIAKGNDISTDMVVWDMA